MTEKKHLIGERILWELLKPQKPIAIPLGNLSKENMSSILVLKAQISVFTDCCVLLFQLCHDGGVVPLAGHDEPEYLLPVFGHDEL